MKNNPLNSINTLARTGLMRTTILMIALTALVTPAKAQVVGSRQEAILAFVKKNTSQQLPHDDGFGQRAVDGCSTQIERYFSAWQRNMPPGTPERFFVTEIDQSIIYMARAGMGPDYPSIPLMIKQANDYTVTIREQTDDFRLHPDRTTIPDNIIGFEWERCIRLVVARMPIPPPYVPADVAPSSNTITATGAATAAPSSQRVQPQPAPVPPPVPLSLEQDRAEKAAERAVRAEWNKSTPDLPDCTRITVNTHEEDLCLKNLSETIYRNSMKWAELAERDRAKLGSAYARMRSAFEVQVREGNRLCERLKNSSAPCDLSAESASRPVLPSRVIARDGRIATDCVKLVQLARSNSSTSGGGSVLSNQCTDTVTIGWCSVGGECERGLGNMVNVLPGRSWPVDANHEVRWGACHGVNTLHGDPGSKGLSFTCSAPETDQ